jgi:hypothetical protein
MTIGPEPGIRIVKGWVMVDFPFSAPERRLVVKRRAVVEGRLWRKTSFDYATQPFDRLRGVAPLRTCKHSSFCILH